MSQVNTRSFGFPLVSSFNALAPMLGYVMGFYLLSQDIADYKFYFTIVASINCTAFCFILLLIPESLPKADRRDFHWSAQRLVPFACVLAAVAAAPPPPLRHVAAAAGWFCR